MRISDDIIIELCNWYKTKPNVDAQIKTPKRIDFVMYYIHGDGQYGNCTEIELCKWLSPYEDLDSRYDFDVMLTRNKITIEIANPYTKIELDVKDYIGLSEEEFFQYSVVHDIPHISPESLVLLAELSTLLQEVDYV